jgi:hypothetical protein
LFVVDEKLSIGVAWLCLNSSDAKLVAPVVTWRFFVLG